MVVRLSFDINILIQQKRELFLSRQLLQTQSILSANIQTVRSSRVIVKTIQKKLELYPLL